jgi:hypothetical protein
MKRLSLTLIAKLFAAVLLLVVVRCLGEVFRLEYASADGAVSYAAVRPYIIAALAAALSLALALLTIQLARPRAAIIIACLTVAGLFVYRVYVIA